MPLKMLHLRSIPVILKVLLHRKGRALCPSRSCPNTSTDYVSNLVPSTPWHWGTCPRSSHLISNETEDHLDGGSLSSVRARALSPTHEQIICVRAEKARPDWAWCGARSTPMSDSIIASIGSGPIKKTRMCWTPSPKLA